MKFLPLLTARTQMYDLLSRLYLTAPTSQVLKALQDAGAADELKQYLDPRDEISGNLERLAQELGVEFCRLFNGPPAIVAPYESLFLANRRRGEGNGQFGNPACRLLGALYAREGFRPPAAYEGLPDHVGVELSFMSHASQLLEKAAVAPAGEAFSNIAILQSQFLEHHLAKWVPQFCRSIEEHSTSSFYVGLARLTMDYIRADRKQTEGLARTYALAESQQK